MKGQFSSAAFALVLVCALFSPFSSSSSPKSSVCEREWAAAHLCRAASCQHFCHCSSRNPHIRQSRASSNRLYMSSFFTCTHLCFELPFSCPLLLCGHIPNSAQKFLTLYWDFVSYFKWCICRLCRCILLSNYCQIWQISCDFDDKVLMWYAFSYTWWYHLRILESYLTFWIIYLCWLSNLVFCMLLH